MRLICITGIDGAGKTTLAKSAVEALQEAGTPASYVYGRTYPLVSRLLMAVGRAVFLRKKDIWGDYQDYERGKQSVIRNPLLAWGYTVAILLDYYLQIWLKLGPYLFSRRTILVDRYIYDTVINDLSAHLGYTLDQTMRAIERGPRLLPRPELLILIDLPEEVAFARKDDIPHIDYLRARRGLYLSLEDRSEVTTLDGLQDPGEIFKGAMGLIAKLE